MLTFLFIILSAGILVFIFLPSLSSAVIGDNLPEDGNPLENLNSKKDTVYNSIRELDFEYSMGRMAENDYHQLRNEYKQQASQLIEQIDFLEKGASDIDLWIENAVATRRKNNAPGTENVDLSGIDTHEASDANKAAEKICPKCQTSNPVQNKFCTSCGCDMASLRQR